MAPPLKLPITNALMGSDYTGVVEVGAAGTPIAVILDTGSSTLAIDGARVDPLASPDARTTNLAQQVSYGAGGWAGAVVQTAVALAPDVRLPAVNVAVTYAESPGMFGGAQGILGLAYAPLDTAYVMPGDTWAAKYPPAQIVTGAPIELAPYFTQLEQAGVVGNKFALYTKRATVSLATADPASDPLNHGLLVIGGGEEVTELYAGGFTQIAVVDDRWYNTNLLAVQVGDQPPIAVAPTPAGSPQVSNSIVDSGTNCVLFDQPLFERVVASFGALDPTFAAALAAHAVGGAGLAHAQLALAAWPPLRLTLQGADGAPATIAIAPGDYWQLDAAGPGLALAYLCGDGGAQGGRSILGLPLFSGHYTVFDRALGAGRGVISFATRR